MGSAASLSFPRSDIDLSCLAVRSVSTLSDRPVVDEQARAVVPMLEASKERIGALKSQIVSKMLKVRQTLHKWPN